ncbi:glycosyltransferase family 2 protein [Candidatus Daviesbacteria bacterium]|nr:glycosyltransferase family 2 protein [Candidatus Daviesbacteria bacterium]
MKTLSIIIPVYNEEKTVGVLLGKVVDAKLPAGFKKEIIIIDDGSTDKTESVLSKCQMSNLSAVRQDVKCQIFRHNTNQGKGAAIRTGLKHVTGDYIIIQDADLEYNPADYKELLKPILEKKAKVVYGTRLKNYPLRLWGENKTILPLHLIANKFLTFMTNMLYGSKLSDMETCYKLLTKNVLTGFDLQSNRFEIEPEITAKILKRGFSILEIPIKVTPRTHKEGKKISWKDGFRAVFSLVKYRFYD